MFTTGDRDTVRIFAWGAGGQEPGSQQRQGGSSSSPTRNKKADVSYGQEAGADAMDARWLQWLRAGARGSYQFVEDTVVELHLSPAAFPEVVVVVLETLPVGLELVQAVSVDILDAMTGQYLPLRLKAVSKDSNIHASGTARHLPALLQAVDLSAAIGLVLALHEVVIESLAAVSNKISCTHKRCRCGTDLLDLGDVVGHGRGVHQDSLVEAVRRGYRLAFHVDFEGRSN